MEQADAERPETDCDLPRALVRRIVKAKLSGVADDGKDVGVTKDALTALAESAKVFVSMIASTANDICQEKRRSTVNADDVFNALSDLDFPELVGPLREQLEAFREALKERNKNRPAKKRKGATYDAPLVVPRNPVAAADGNGDADEAAAAAGGGADSDVNGADDDGAAGGLRDTDGDDGDGPGVLGGGATTDDDGLGALGMGLGLGSGLGGVDGDGDGDLVENMLVDGPP